MNYSPCSLEITVTGVTSLGFELNAVLIIALIFATNVFSLPEGRERYFPPKNAVMLRCIRRRQMYIPETNKFENAEESIVIFSATRCGSIGNPYNVAKNEYINIALPWKDRVERRRWCIFLHAGIPRIVATKALPPERKYTPRTKIIPTLHNDAMPYCPEIFRYANALLQSTPETPKIKNWNNPIFFLFRARSHFLAAFTAIIQAAQALKSALMAQKLNAEIAGFII